MPTHKPSGQNPGPPPDPDGFGRYETGAIRVRPSWFGFAVVEEQIEDVDGSRYWKRIRSSVLVKSPQWLNGKWQRRNGDE